MVRLHLKLYHVFTELFGYQITDCEMHISATKEMEKARKELNDMKAKISKVSVLIDWLLLQVPDMVYGLQIMHMKDQLATTQKKHDKGRQELDQVLISSAILFSMP